MRGEGGGCDCTLKSLLVSFNGFLMLTWLIRCRLVGSRMVIIIDVIN